MADSQRTRSQVLADFADNVTGQISPQDLRNFVVTVMNAEFKGVGDFWHGPDPQYLTTDETARGWVLTSQLISVACSIGDVLMMNASGAWEDASVAAIHSDVRRLGLAVSTHAAASATGNVLIKGLLKCAAMSTTWSEIGKMYYLDSGAAGKMSVASAALMSLYVGLGSPVPEGSDYTVDETDVFMFDPSWGVMEYS